MFKYDLKEVFNANTFPVYTYIERNISGNRTYSSQIKLELKKQDKLIFVTGAFASGKSALCQNAVPTSQRMIINGRKIFNIDAFNNLCLQAVRIKGLSGGIHFEYQNEYSRILVIEDFHLIDSNLQMDIANLLKQKLESGMKIVITSLPYKSDKAIILNEKLAANTTHVHIQPWSAKDLEKIAQIGFELINMQVDTTDLKLLINASISSPKVMQENCYELAEYCQRKQIQYIGMKEIAEVLLKKCGE